MALESAGVSIVAGPSFVITWEAVLAIIPSSLSTMASVFFGRGQRRLTAILSIFASLRVR